MQKPLIGQRHWQVNVLGGISNTAIGNPVAPGF
jgi:hypothetical protein